MMRYGTPIITAIICALWGSIVLVHGLVVPWVGLQHGRHYISTASPPNHQSQRRLLVLQMTASNEDTGEVGSGPNWIERSFPVNVAEEEEVSPKSVEDYNLGISGVSFQTGPLSRRMYDAIMSSNASPTMSEEVQTAFTLYAMDFTAKEATKAALKQNGLEMALEKDMEDEGLWGDVDSIQLLDTDTQEPVGPLHDTTDEAIEHWTPGQGFNFCVRQVPAKMRELSMDELLQALDPDGDLRKEAKERGMTLPDEEISTLQELANDCMRRSQFVPRENENDSFEVPDKRGYSVVSRSNLLRDSINADGTENQKTLMHVMDALVSHGALVVDLTDDGTTYKLATELASMWESVETLYSALDKDPNLAQTLPPGTTRVQEETGSRFSKIGYSSYNDGTVQMMETRCDTNDNVIAPVQDILTADDTQALRDAFDVLVDVGKDVIRIATAASSMEASAFMERNGDVSVLSSDKDDGTSAAVQASQAATLLTEELVDDGYAGDEAALCMTSQSLCRYKQSPTETDNVKVYGPSTDPSLVKLVPVSALVGLEVWDEDMERWYRPELVARKHWQDERKARNEDFESEFESIPSLEEDEEQQLPWHSRYVVVLPGELLQLMTRNEVPAAVSRQVPNDNDESPRLSAPISVCGHAQSKLNVERYLGSTTDSPLLTACKGMTLEEIQDGMQPSSFQ